MAIDPELLTAQQQINAADAAALATVVDEFAPDSATSIADATKALEELPTKLIDVQRQNAVTMISAAFQAIYPQLRDLQTSAEAASVPPPEPSR